MHRFWFEFRLSSGCPYQPGRLWQIKVNELSAIVADRMIVTIDLPVVTAGAIAKLNFMNKSRFLQESERIVDRCITNRRQAQTGRLENLIRSWMIVPIANYLKNRLSLRRQFFPGIYFFSSLSH